MLKLTFAVSVVAAALPFVLPARVDREPELAFRAVESRSRESVPGFAPPAVPAGSPSGVVEAGPCPPWTTSLRSRVIAPPPPPPPPPLKKLEAPRAVLTAVAGFEGVDLAWSGGTAPWSVERRREGGDWTKIAERVEATGWRDASAEPRTRYEYRVSSSEPVSVRTPGIWRLHFDSPSAAREDGSPAMVRIRIEKRDPVAGLVASTRIHREGERVGGRDEVRSAALGRTLPVDFATGGVLKRVEVDAKEPYTWRRARVRPTAAGPEFLGYEQVADHATATRVVFTDDEGREETRVLSSGPRKADQTWDPATQRVK